MIDVQVVKGASGWWWFEINLRCGAVPTLHIFLSTIATLEYAMRIGAHSVGL
jgi:hypothetical protein